MKNNGMQPLLTPWHRLVQDDERLVLEYGGEAVVFEGRAVRALLPALLPLLDGTYTVAEICATLGDTARPAVEHALDILSRHGVLTEGPPLPAALPRPLAAAALLHAAGDPGLPSPQAAHQRLADASVVVLGGNATAAEIARSLRLSGVGQVDRCAWDEPPAADVLAVAAPLPAELEQLPAWNELALTTGAPWLQVLPYNGAFAAVGPLYLPAETCCYECYRRRRAANVDYPDVFWALERASNGPPDAPAVAAVAGGLAALACLRWLVSRDPATAGVLHAVELADGLRLTSHAVYRVPRCPACSSGTAGLPLPWAEAS